jgi:hypothetical protein
MNDMNVMYAIYSMRSISYIIARAGNNELNVMSVMYSTRSISYVIARAGNNELDSIHHIHVIIICSRYDMADTPC